MQYHVGWPLWRLAARAGLPLKVLVCVHRDEDAGVFFAHSPNLRGLVVESPTLQGLSQEIDDGIVTLMEELVPHRVAAKKPTADLRIDGAYCVA